MDYTIGDFYRGGIRDYELASDAYALKHGIEVDNDSIESEDDLDDLYSRIGA